MMLYITDCMKLNAMPENCRFAYKIVPAKYVEKMRDNVAWKYVVCDGDNAPGTVTARIGSDEPISIVPGDVIASGFQTREGDLRFRVLRVLDHDGNNA